MFVAGLFRFDLVRVVSGLETETNACNKLTACTTDQNGSTHGPHNPDASDQ